jgi:hypothetical protein
MIKVIVMNYGDKSINIHNVNDELDNFFDELEFYEKYDYNYDECCFMICDDLTIRTR